MVERFVQCFIEKSYGDRLQRDRDTVAERGTSIVSRNCQGEESNRFMIEINLKIKIDRPFMISYLGKRTTIIRFSTFSFIRKVKNCTKWLN